MRRARSPWLHIQRRGISKWFRSQWCDIRLACGGLPPSHTPLAAIRNPLRIKESYVRKTLRGHEDECRDEFLAQKKIAQVGFVHSGFDCSIDDVRWIGRSKEENRSQGTVSLIWDIHNKPEGMDPCAAAKRTIEIASVFGTVVERTAYASRRMLCFLPLFKREYNKVRDIRIEDGEIVEKCLDCPLCGIAGGRHHMNLVTHFRMKHERARGKLIFRMHTAASREEKERWRKILLHGEAKYQKAARVALTPRVLLPDGLPMALIKAGFFVKQMPDRPAKAPDMAVWSHILQVANLGINCICLVCDNVNYTGALEFARRLNVHTVLIGIGARQSIKEMANLYVSWEEVVTGKAMAMAEQAAASWAANARRKAKRAENTKVPYAVQEDDMFFEYYDDLYPSSPESSEFEWSESDESD